MIRFFRRVREKLIGEGNIGRYLLYAIGEILLVVFGILIALQVNNWNEERANTAKELHYLKGIHSDAIKQIQSLESTLIINKYSISVAYELLSDYLDDNAFDENDSTFIRINAINRSAAPTAIKTSFLELVNGSNIELIANEALRNEIVLFYQLLDEMVANSNQNAEVIFQNHLVPVFYKRTLIDPEKAVESFNMEMGLPSLGDKYSSQTKQLAYKNLNDPDQQVEFINALNLKAIIEGLQKSRSEDIIRLAENLISNIEKEVRDRHGIMLTSY